MVDTKIIHRKTALLAEEGFFERINGNIARAPGVYCPLDGKTYDATGQNKNIRCIDTLTEELKLLIKENVQKNFMELYDAMPKNSIILHEIMHKDIFTPKSTKVVIATFSISPMKDLLLKGYSTEQMTGNLLNQIREEIIESSNVFYYIGAFSPAGWNNTAKNALSGKNFLIALCDIYEGAWRTYREPDNRWDIMYRLFDLCSKSEKIEYIKRFVEKHTLELLMDELTEDLVRDKLYYDSSIIYEAFEAIEEENDYIVFNTREKPHRLVRVY